MLKLGIIQFNPNIRFFSLFIFILTHEITFLFLILSRKSDKIKSYYFIK